MHPIICTVGAFHVYSYGLMLVVAFIVSTSLIIWQAKQQKMDPDIIFNFAFTVFIAGIIGGRIFYVVNNAPHYLKNPLEIVMLHYGGLSWFGGLILGTIAGIIYMKRKGLGVYHTLDLVMPYIALAHAIGRIGCLLNGCCFGKSGPIPTQIYASLSLLAIFVILRLMQNRPWPTGTIFYSYLFLYSIKRFIIEFFRQDNERIFHGLTLFQLLSIVLFIFATTKLLLIRSSQRKP